MPSFQVLRLTCQQAADAASPKPLLRAMTAWRSASTPQKQHVQKAEAEARQLRGGTGPAKGATPPPVSDEVNALEKQLHTFRAALAEAPEDEHINKIVKATEAEIEKASPKT